MYIHVQYVNINVKVKVKVNVKPINVDNTQIKKEISIFDYFSKNKLLKPEDWETSIADMNYVGYVTCIYSTSTNFFFS